MLRSEGTLREPLVPEPMSVKAILAAGACPSQLLYAPAGTGAVGT